MVIILELKKHTNDNMNDSINIEEKLQNSDIYTCIMEEFSIEDMKMMEAPDNFESSIMEKIKYIETDYTKRRVGKNLMAYVILLSASFAICLASIIYFDKVYMHMDIKEIPILYDYFSIFSNIPEISSLTFSSLIHFLKDTISIIFRYTKYVSVLGIVFLISVQYYLYRRKSINL